MDSHVEDVTRLSLLIQRILDADALCDTEGAMLLRETEAARQCLRDGDAEAARKHIEQVALFIEALVRADALALTDGRAVIETANGILSMKECCPTDGEEP